MDKILGEALIDYYHKKPTEKLLLYARLNRGMDGDKPHDGDFYYSLPAEEDLAVYFRTVDKMPSMELTALEHCRGRILDVGAGAGCHALALQRMGQDVTALDHSPLSAVLMKEQGIKKIICQNIYSLEKPAYDTLLLLWNGTGLTGTLAGFRKLLAKAAHLLQPGGQILIDSTDVALYFEKTPSTEPPYYGETSFKHEYKNHQSNWYKWLFVDRLTLRRVAEEEGWEVELLAENHKIRNLGEFLVRCRQR
jgi:SAM-dependent methyltransferase